jgi:hypothetical protein
MGLFFFYSQSVGIDPFDKMIAKNCLLDTELPLNATHLCTTISYGAMMALVFSVDKPELDIDEVKKVKFRFSKIFSKLHSKKKLEVAIFVNCLTGKRTLLILFLVAKYF